MSIEDTITKKVKEILDTKFEIHYSKGFLKYIHLQKVHYFL